MDFHFEQIESSFLLKKTIRKVFNNADYEFIKRPGCFFIRAKNEDKKIIQRMILFQPKGFTGNKLDLLNPHPETRTAKIEILGKLNPIKQGYKPLIREVNFIFSLKREMATEQNSPYAKYSKKFCRSRLLSWKNWFYVIKESGWGNFHSLINLSNEWVVVILEKNLIDQKPINLEPILKKIPQRDAKILSKHLKEIELLGDKIFDHPNIVRTILSFTADILISALIQMLNIQETGRHEPCTVFALILEIARKNKPLVLTELNKAIKLDLAPYYYLEDLEKKLKR